MRILVLGATGRTGKLLLDEALGRGYIVHALVRNKKKVSATSSNLVLFEGSPDNVNDLEPAMIGCEAVLSALNISRTSDWPWSRLRTGKNFLSTVMNNLILLAPKHSIHRIIFISAWGAGETKQDIPAWFRWLIDHSNIRFPYADHTKQEDIARHSGLNWTAVRPVGLTNSKKRKKLTVSLENSPKPKLLVCRQHVADFMLDALEKDLFVKQNPVISGG